MTTGQAFPRLLPTTLKKKQVECIMKKVLFGFAIALTVVASQIPARTQSNEPAQVRATDAATTGNSGDAANTPENPHAKKSHAPKKRSNNRSATASDGTAATPGANAS